MGRRHHPLLRASAELLNAVYGVRPLGRDGYPTVAEFAFGWPTSEMAPLYMAGSMLGAIRRWLRGDYRDRRGRIALLLKVITWGLLGLIMHRNVTSEQYFEKPLEETLGEDYELASSDNVADADAVFAALTTLAADSGSPAQSSADETLHDIRRERAEAALEQLRRLGAEVSTSFGADVSAPRGEGVVVYLRSRWRGRRPAP